MAYFPAEYWVALLGLGALGILSILHTLATLFQRDRDLHDLRKRASDLRRGYSERIAALRAREHGIASAPIQVDVIEDEPATAGSIGQDGGAAGLRAA